MNPYVMVPNVFIDEVMPQIDWASVKLYLVLLREQARYGEVASIQVSLSALAMLLDVSHASLRNALRELAQAGVVKVDPDQLQHHTTLSITIMRAITPSKGQAE